MKKFWLLFSFLLFTLSVYPCSEIDDCEKNTKTEVTKKDNHKDQKSNTEHCTPFCTCSHCQAPAFYLNISNFNFKKNIPFFQEKKLLSNYSLLHPNKITLNIWQPPKINC